MPDKAWLHAPTSVGAFDGFRLSVIDMSTIEALPIISVSTLVIGAAAWDVARWRIPNLLIMAGAAMGILLQGVMAGPSGVLAALSGLGVGLAVLLPGYLLGFTGAGDVKLMAAVGTFLGIKGVLMAAIFSIGVGGIIALGFAASSLIAGTSAGPWGRYSLMFRTLITTGKPIYITPTEGEVMGKKFPFAVSIALGTCGYLIWAYMH